MWRGYRHRQRSLVRARGDKQLTLSVKDSQSAIPDFPQGGQGYQLYSPMTSTGRSAADRFACSPNTEDGWIPASIAGLKGSNHTVCSSRSAI